MKNKSKYYWDLDRNLPIDDIIIKQQLMKENKVPKYYKGKNGYEAIKVVHNFDLNYNCGTAVTYILRSNKKHDTPIECLQKEINHLEFEIDRIKND